MTTFLSNAPELVLVLLSSVSTIFAAIVGAYFAAARAYRFTRKQEREKFDRETYQTFYAPIILDVFYFLEMVAMKSDEDFSSRIDRDMIDERFDKILSHIDKQITYATPALISARYRLRQEEIRGLWDREPPTRLSKIHMLSIFMDDLYKLVDSSGIYDKSSRKSMNKYRFLYAVWYLMTSIGGYNKDEKGILLIREMRRIHDEEASMKIYENANKIAKSTQRHHVRDRFEEVLEYIGKQTFAKRPQYINTDRLIQESREIDERNPDYR